MPFYVALPSPTIDFTVSDGVAEIPIEQRGAEEQSTMTGRTADGRIETVQIVPDGSPVANYGFDVTPARLVTGLITERGVLKASREGLAAAFPERAGGSTMMRRFRLLAVAALVSGTVAHRAGGRGRTSRSSTARSASSPARSSCGSGWSTSIPAPATRRVCGRSARLPSRSCKSSARPSRRSRQCPRLATTSSRAFPAPAKARCC